MVCVGRERRTNFPRPAIGLLVPRLEQRNNLQKVNMNKPISKVLISFACVGAMLVTASSPPLNLLSANEALAAEARSSTNE